METAKNTPREWKTGKSCLYCLNQEGEYEFYVSVQAGFNDSGKRPTDSERDEIAYDLARYANNFEKLAEALNDLRMKYVNLWTHAMQYGANEHTLEAAARATLVLRDAGIEVQP